MQIQKNGEAYDAREEDPAIRRKPFREASVDWSRQLREAYARGLERLLGRKQMEIEILEAARDVVKKSPWLRKGSGR